MAPEPETRVSLMVFKPDLLSVSDKNVKGDAMRNLLKLGVVAVITMALWNPGTSAAQGLPSGSYQQTCRNVGLNGSSISATCQDTNGNWQSTQLPDYQRCSSEIVNDNGMLRCGAVSSYNNNTYNGNY